MNSGKLKNIMKSDNKTALIRFLAFRVTGIFCIIKSI